MGGPLCIYLRYRPAERLDANGARRPIMDEYCSWPEHHRDALSDAPDWLFSVAIGSVGFQSTNGPRPSCHECAAYVPSRDDED